MLLKNPRWFKTAEVQEVKTDEIIGDQMWSFVRKKPKIANQKIEKRETVGWELV